MILSQLSGYLKLHGRVSLQDMQHHLETTPEALEGMLAVLERKGRVRRLPGGTPCGNGSCCKCDPAGIVVYEWVAVAEPGEHP